MVERQAERKIAYHDAGEMCIQHSAILVILPMDLQEVGSEVLHDSLVIVLAFSERGNAVKEVIRHLTYTE